MTITGYTADGTAYTLPVPISLRIERAYDIPADKLEAVFPMSGTLPELHAIYAERDGKAVFYGVVDEQSAETSGEGALLRLSGRSLAALLLDNEAMAQVYRTPTIQEIFERHAAPYGLAGVRGSSLSYSGTLTVGKGQSEWTVLSRFCKSVGNLMPRVTPDSYLDVRSRTGSAVTTYSNTAAGGVRYTVLAHTVKRCEPVSEVVLKAESGGGYQFTEQNCVVRGNGIRRRRLLEIKDSAGAVQRTARELMRDSNAGYVEYAVRVPGGHFPAPGDSARIVDSTLGTVTGLIVSEARYTRSAQGDRCDIVLIPESHLTLR